MLVHIKLNYKDNYYHYNYNMSKYVLKLCVTSADRDLHDLYDVAIKKKEDADIRDPRHPDSGFDLYIPKNLEFQPWETQIVDLEIRCAAYKYNSQPGSHTSSFEEACVRGQVQPAPFYIYPRSSICKTPFRLANGTGIIDSGYRGNLKGAFDCAKPSNGVMGKYYF